MGIKAEVDQLYNALINGPAVQLTRWPNNAVGAGLTGSGMTTGAYKYAAAGANQVQLVTAAQNTVGMWLTHLGVDTPSVLADEILVLWAGRGTIPAAVRAAELQFAVLQDTAVGYLGVHASQPLPMPVFVRAAVGIALDLANATANDTTANGHAIIATGLGA